MSDQEVKRLGYWLSAKKSKKLSLSDIEESLRLRKIEPVKIDLEKPLEKQGPFHGVLHKLTDFIAQAEIGDKQAQKLMNAFQEYTSKNPNMVVIDPIDCLRTLINRYKTYNLIDKSFSQLQDSVFVPKFVALESSNIEGNILKLKESGVTFPAVCKPIVAHGSTSAHQMTLVFNENGLREAVIPCVVQSFVNHNAVLYKIFALGKRNFLVERPSIKNFNNCEDLPPIHFDGGEISKQNSTSLLNVQDNISSMDNNKPCIELLNLISEQIQHAMGLKLVGIDVVVEHSTGRLAVVDVNAFPGYDGVEDFADKLAEFVRNQLDMDKELVNNERIKTREYSQNEMFHPPIANGNVEIEARANPIGDGVLSSRLINQTSI